MKSESQDLAVRLAIFTAVALVFAEGRAMTMEEAVEYALSREL